LTTAAPARHTMWKLAIGIMTQTDAVPTDKQVTAFPHCCKCYGERRLL